MLISILVLQLLYVRFEGLDDFYWFVRSFMWLCLVHFLACIGSSVAADVLVVASCASPCCRPGWPSSSTKSALGASNGGEFTVTVAAGCLFLNPVV
jgi:hypothetical protein